MSRRSVFISKSEYPYFEEILVEFHWFGGFALSQKRKCAIGLHLNFNNKYNNKVLEVSSSSISSLGYDLSAMHLTKETSKGVTSVESAFQSSRIYSPYNGSKDKIGPFPDYLFLDGKTCKAIVKEKSKGYHSYEYEFDGMVFPAPDYHISLFYDYLYINALCEEGNREVVHRLNKEGYSAFTDLATKSLNSQARACAIYIGLRDANKLDDIKDFDKFMDLFRVGKSDAYENVQVFDGKKVNLLSPVAPKVYGEGYVDTYYRKWYSNLTNKKSDTYRRICLADINFKGVCKKDLTFYNLIWNNEVIAVRTKVNNMYFDVPLDLVEQKLEVSGEFKLLNRDGEYLTEDEYNNKILYPCVSNLNTELLSIINM